MEKTIQIINSILDDIGQDFIKIPISIINTTILIFFVIFKFLTDILIWGGLIFAIVIAITPNTLIENSIYIAFGFISLILRLMVKRILRDF